MAQLMTSIASFITDIGIDLFEKGENIRRRNLPVWLLHTGEGGREPVFLFLKKH